MALLRTDKTLKIDYSSRAFPTAVYSYDCNKGSLLTLWANLLILGTSILSVASALWLMSDSSPWQVCCFCLFGLAVGTCLIIQHPILRLDYPLYRMLASITFAMSAFSIAANVTTHSILPINFGTDTAIIAISFCLATSIALGVFVYGVVLRHSTLGTYYCGRR